jgi:hypothetical protein
MPTFEDYREYWQLTQANPHAKLADAERRLQQLSVAMSGLKGDPRWVTYADHLKAIEERHAKAAEEATRRLFSGPMLSGPEYATLRMEVEVQKAWRDAMKAAISLIDSLITEKEAEANGETINS